MPAKELPPVLQYLKDNIVVIGILAVLAVSIGFYAISQASAKTPDAAPVPAAPEVTALPLDSTLASQGPAAPTAAPATAAAGGTSYATANATRGDGPVVGSPAGPTSAPEFVAGGAQQAVTAQDWRPPVEAFSAAWANPEGGKYAWLSRMKPYATPALESSLGYTDIGRIPADKLSTVSTIDKASGTVSFKAYYDDGGLRFQGIAVLQPNGTWLVDKVAPPEKK